MTRRFDLILLLFFSLSFSLIGEAQEGFIELRFSATESGGKVFLDWTMDLGLTCNGIAITRSTDSLNYSEIGNIPGVCGSPFDTISYSFIDEFPVLNQINYYRLVLGTIGITQTVSVEIINLEGTGYQIRPNPMTDRGRIYFANDRNQEHKIILFSTSGVLIKQARSRRDFFELDVSNLRSGLYIFQIETDRGDPISIGKFLVN